MYMKNLERIESEEVIMRVIEQLEPCPCIDWQAQRDWNRFRSELSHGFCFVQRFAVEVPEFEGKFTQQCCYAPRGLDNIVLVIENHSYYLVLKRKVH